MEKKCKQKPSAELVTVAIVNYSYEAEMIKSILEEEGYLVFLKDEFMSQIYVNAVGCVQVQVPGDVAEAARQLLIAGNYVK